MIGPLPNAHASLAASNARSVFRLKAATAFLWLATALSVLHPYYRSIGHTWLSMLGLPDLFMWLACAGELVLGLLILTLPPRRWLMLLQVLAVGCFTVVLGVLDPSLLVHPFGVLSKNLPFLAVVVTVWLLASEGWSTRTWWILRAGMAVVWITEGVFPKLLFIRPEEVEVVARSGLAPFSPVAFLMFLGAAQAASGILALVLKGSSLRAFLAAQIAGLVILPLLVSAQDPLLWLHPFGPMTKNIPILVGTLEVLRRC